jgi:hypothetical protein
MCPLAVEVKINDSSICHSMNNITGMRETMHHVGTCTTWPKCKGGTGTLLLNSTCTVPQQKWCFPTPHHSPWLNQGMDWQAQTEMALSEEISPGTWHAKWCWRCCPPPWGLRWLNCNGRVLEVYYWKFLENHLHLRVQQKHPHFITGAPPLALHGTAHCHAATPVEDPFIQ